MSGLVAGNRLQVSVEDPAESSTGEVILGVILQAIGVEGSLEMLQGQGIVEDVACTYGSGIDTFLGVHNECLLNVPSLGPARLCRGEAEARPAAAPTTTQDENFMMNKGGEILWEVRLYYYYRRTWKE